MLLSQSIKDKIGCLLTLFISLLLSIDDVCFCHIRGYYIDLLPGIILHFFIIAFSIFATNTSFYVKKFVCILQMYTRIRPFWLFSSNNTLNLKCKLLNFISKSSITIILSWFDCERLHMYLMTKNELAAVIKWGKIEKNIHGHL